MTTTPSQFLSICEYIGLSLQKEIEPLIGNQRGGRVVGMGADNTPTEYIDQVAEDLVISILKSKKACTELLSEEKGWVDIGGDSNIVYLDPIDGTYNAVSGIPYYALSIALSDGEKLLAGYVKDLSNGDTFTAINGQGAYLNCQPIHVSTELMLDHSAMSIYGKKFDITRMIQLGHKIRRWRLLGASALELCYVACGRIDGFVDLRNTLRITDAAAGILICQESGGIVTRTDGKPLVYPNNVDVGFNIVATNNVIHQKVIEYLRS